MLEHYLARVALLTNSDTAEQGDKVKLMTVHTAKGLEFPYVFLCGLNEGVFPSRKTGTQEAMEEERRLAFVAVTRAQKRLYLSAAAGVNFDESIRYPSRFLLEVDQGLLEYAQPISERDKKEAWDFINAKERYRGKSAGGKEAEFAKGDKIVHRVFGQGEIMSVDDEKKAYRIRFDSMATPREISFRVKMAKVLQ